MNNETAEQVALFRYALISPLLSGKVHDVPHYGSKEFAPKTIEIWLSSYRKGGFAATGWEGDMSIGYYLIIWGKKYKTFLVAFLDDCSRLVPFAQFFFTEKLQDQEVFLG